MGQCGPRAVQYEFVGGGVVDPVVSGECLSIGRADEFVYSILRSDGRWDTVLEKLDRDIALHLAEVKSL